MPTPLFALVAAALVAAAPARPAPPPSLSFVVVGHARGREESLSPRLPELLADLRRDRPGAVVLPGDIIWGDYEHVPRRPEQLAREWNAIDSAFGTLGAPIIRAPGNHDISDVVTRDVWRQRYGGFPRVERVGGVRFIALNSSWTPADGDTARNRFVRGVPIDSAQLAALRAELAGPDTVPTFVVMHHLLWWQADTAAWWREVHPLLRDAGVKAVLTGEYGPMKFSHTERDGVQYYQVCLGGNPTIELLWATEANRSLAAQFDNYLRVDVEGDSVRYRVMTVGSASSGHFAPERWRRVYLEQPQPTLTVRAKRFVSSPVRFAFVSLLGLGAIGVGYALGRRVR